MAYSKNTQALIDVSVAAQNAGMSYGKYVAKLEASKKAPERLFCAYCGKRMNSKKECLNKDCISCSSSNV